MSVLRNLNMVDHNVIAHKLRRVQLSRNRTAKAQKRNNQQVVENTIKFDQGTEYQPRRVDLVPRTTNQEKLVLALLDQQQHIVVTAGPAGTGKTYLAMQAAVKNLREGNCDKLILTRPAVTVENEQHGFLPGNLIAKMEPWTRPLIDVLRENYRHKDIIGMLEDQIIEISPLGFMRGRTFKNAWIIADEMQNATPMQIKMLLTRIGHNSKIVLTGDIEQTDRTNSQNGLMDICRRLSETSIIGMSVCELSTKDIQRHHIIDRVLQLYSQS
jgi:phosphate starvation-inducible PhoH-like protein